MTYYCDNTKCPEFGNAVEVVQEPCHCGAYNCIQLQFVCAQCGGFIALSTGSGISDYLDLKGRIWRYPNDAVALFFQAKAEQGKDAEHFFGVSSTCYLFTAVNNYSVEEMADFSERTVDAIFSAEGAILCVQSATGALGLTLYESIDDLTENWQKLHSVG